MYGPSLMGDKLHFLEKIFASKKLVRDSLWIVVGDSNLIRSLKDKKWGVQKLNAESTSFDIYIEQVQLVDNPTINGLNNWNNRPEEDTK